MLNKIAWIIVLLPVSVFAEDWYVTQKTGNGLPSGDGTICAPWNGFSNIDWDLINPGDSISLFAGQWNESLLFGASGAEGAPITVIGGWQGCGKGYSGRSVIFGGKQASQDPGDWVENVAEESWTFNKFVDGTAATGRYKAALIDGVPIQNSEDPNFSLFYGDQDDNAFRRSLFPSNEPWNHEIYVSFLEYCLFVDHHHYIDFTSIDFSLSNGYENVNSPKANVTLYRASNISFTDADSNYGSLAGVWITESDDVIIDGMEIYGNYWQGLYSRGGSSNITIKNSKVYENGKHWQVGRSADSGAILIGGWGAGNNITVKNNLIYDNYRPTALDNVEGDKPNGLLSWAQYSANVYQKDLTSLKRWNPTNPVKYLGIDNINLPGAPGPDLVDSARPWYWDETTRILYLYSEIDPNKRSDSIQIAWANGSDPAISLWGIKNARITNNIIRDNYTQGICSVYTVTENVTIEDNLIENNLLNTSNLKGGWQYGISVSGQGGHIIRNNTVINNGGRELEGNRFWAGGIQLTSNPATGNPAANITVTGNTVIGNGGLQLTISQDGAGTSFAGLILKENNISGDISIDQ